MVRDPFTSFLTRIPFISFSWINVLIRTFGMMSHQSDEREHVYCVSDISISIQSFTIKYDFSCSFFMDALYQAFQVALVVKNPPANAGDTRDSGSSLGQEDPLGKTMATHSSIHAWRNLWTEEPGRLQSTGSPRVGHD